jgi:membrane protein YdbS with pleckstrin-like domain
MSWKKHLSWEDEACYVLIQQVLLLIIIIHIYSYLVNDSIFTALAYWAVCIYSVVYALIIRHNHKSFKQKQQK